jgi:hypothetical protein
MKNIKSFLTVFFVLAVFLASAAAQDSQETKVVKLDVKYDSTTYVNRGPQVILVVNTYLMQKLDKKQAYIPVEVGIGNAASSKVTLSREEFTLVDEAGNIYGVVSGKEIEQNYKRLNFDHEKARIPHIMGPIFAGYTPVIARFTPEAKPGSLVYDKIDLSGNDALVDILYFKMPAANVKGKTFELRLAAPNLKAPASIKFKVD